MKVSELINESNVYSLKTGKKVKPEPISALKAFGSEQLNILHDSGIKLIEKPDYWEDLDKESIDLFTFKRAEKELAKAGIPLKQFAAADIYGSSFKPRSPVMSVKNMPDEQMFTITFSDESRYIVDRTGARSYIRFWAKIN